MKNKAYFSYNGEKNKKTVKKLLYIIPIVLVLLIPAILALINYSISSKNVLVANSVGISLYREGELIAERSDDPQNPEADSLVLIFDSVLGRMKKTDRFPTDLDDSYLFNVTLSTRNESKNYKCYFYTDGSDSYCIDSAKNAYIIDKESADAFFSSTYSECLYNTAKAPRMYTTSDEEVLPYASTWLYKNLSGGFQKAVELSAPESSIEYNMSGTLGISFDVMPEVCAVKVFKSGIKVYEGDIDGLSSFSVEAGTTLKFDVKAKWEYKEDRDFYGDVYYDFKVLVRDRAHFKLNRQNICAGEFVLVSCTNVLDPSKILFSSEPSIDVSPVFVNDHGIARAIIPFSNDKEIGEYKLTFSYGATKQDVILKLHEPEKRREYIVKGENTYLLSNLIDKNKLYEIGAIFDGLEVDTNIYARSEFINPTDLGATPIAQYGALIKGSSESVEHKINGTQFTFKDDDKASVPALNSGKVVAVGSCDYLGKYVVIEHGLALRTLYSHLDTVFVNEGDILAKGELVGICGSLDVVSPKGVFLMCFVYDVAVDPEYVAGKTLPFQYYQIEE